MSKKSICVSCVKKTKCNLQDIEQKETTVTLCAGYLGKGQVDLHESDAVNHPEHYTTGGIECIDAIRSSLGDEDFASYCQGNVMKYIWRHRHKGGVEDLKKARVYLNWMIEAEEGTT
jgi:hypothetical protein